MWVKVKIRVCGCYVFLEREYSRLKFTIPALLETRMNFLLFRTITNEPQYIIYIH